MRRSRSLALVLLLTLVTLVGVGCWYRGYLTGLLPSAAADVGDISLPPGFHVSVYASDVPNARQMAVAPNGVVFVGSRSAGTVYAVVDRDGDHRADQVHVVASGLTQPSGVAFRDGALYVAEISRILRFRGVDRDPARAAAPEIVTTAYPSDGHHGWKFIAFGPDGRLYVPVGAPCNVCEPPGPLHATITRVDVADGRPEVVARGVRNSVGFDFHPDTGELWFTDNGRDWLGDDRPPDELNRLARPGLHSASPTATATASVTRSTTAGVPATSSPRPRGRSAPTSPRSACASTPAACFPSGIAAASSSRSTVPGTGRRRSGIV
jgi:glucose/arabinose dehydrogenase